MRLGILAAVACAAAFASLAVASPNLFYKHISSDLVGVDIPLGVSIAIYNLDEQHAMRHVVVNDTHNWPTSHFRLLDEGALYAQIPEIQPGSMYNHSFTVVPLVEGSTISPIPAVVTYEAVVSGVASAEDSVETPADSIVEVTAQTTLVPAYPVHSARKYAVLASTKTVEWGAFFGMALAPTMVPALLYIFLRNQRIQVIRSTRKGK